jgi:hypothetical protein
MALRFGLSDTFMGPQQAAKFGESFGESIGGLGLALGDAWSAYQDQSLLNAENAAFDKWAGIDEFDEATRASDIEIQAMEDKWLSENPGWSYDSLLGAYIAKEEGKKNTNQPFEHPAEDLPNYILK